MELFVQTNNNSGVPVISVSGQIDMSNCVEVYDAILDNINSGAINIILDLKKLSFIDSSCLGMLLRGHDRVRGRGGRLMIIVNPFIERVLTVTGLTHHFNLYLDKNEAWKSMQTIKEKSA